MIIDEAQKEDPAGNCELDGFEIARAQFFTMREKPVMTINNNRISFNTVCLKKFENVEYVELLINTVEKCIAIRPCSKDSPNAFQWGKMKEDRWRATPRSIKGFAAPLYDITGWDVTDRVRLCGQYLADDETQMLIFDLSEPEIIRLVQEGIISADEIRSAEGDKSEVNDGESGNATGNVDEGDNSGETETVEIMRKETIYPEEWEDSFGRRADGRLTWYYERIRYYGNWEILRPARRYAIAGGVNEEVLKEVQRETRRIIEELRCAV